MIDYIEFAISPASCSRIARYLQEYAQKGYDKIYGGLERLPRRGQGGGCSAFGESVLEIGGLMTPEWASGWQHQVDIPLGLIGGPTTGRRVSVLDLLFGIQAWSWASTPADKYALTFWDPAYMYRWIRRAWRHPLPLTGMTYVPVRRRRAPGIRIDATEVPTPTDSFWLEPAARQPAGAPSR